MGDFERLTTEFFFWIIIFFCFFCYDMISDLVALFLFSPTVEKSQFFRSVKIFECDLRLYGRYWGVWFWRSCDIVLFQKFHSNSHNSSTMPTLCTSFWILSFKVQLSIWWVKCSRNSPFSLIKYLLGGGRFWFENGRLIIR